MAKCKNCQNEEGGLAVGRRHRLFPDVVVIFLQSYLGHHSHKMMTVSVLLTQNEDDP